MSSNFLLGANLPAILTAGLLFYSLAFGLAIGLVIAQNLSRRTSVPMEGLVPPLTFGASACIAALLLSGEPYILPALFLALAVDLATRRFFKGFTVGGQLFVTTNVQLMAVGLAWGIWFIATIPVSEVTRVLMFTAYPLVILTLPAAVVQTLEQWEVLCRRSWSRPRTPLPAASGSHCPKIVLHVPVCSEPPEVVIATLNSLARLRYDNFEVLVIDNNTSDPGLWRPVEAHCSFLGDRFRFFHLEEWPGAKAGALNFALEQTSVDTEIIGVIDSDYQTRPDFLEKLVGHFDDPKIGFVQTPHAYREWEGRAYLRTCAWEYRYFFETTMVSLNECDAGLTVGTMCLIRRRALEEAGGWAEWCATEDSELAIRIHARGYSSVYVNEVFGRGLIPETFAGYKRQRFRWTSGPVQELKKHFRLFLPRPFGRPSALSTAQKIHHLNHGLDRAAVGLRLLFVPIAVAVVISMVVHQEIVSVPAVLWAAASVSLAAEFVHWWLAYRVTMRCSLLDMVRAMIASKALFHTITISSAWALANKRVPWVRTNKFTARPSNSGALSAWPELMIGLAILAFAACAFLALPQQGLVLMFLIGAVYYALNYFAAPALALLAERDIRLRQQVTPAPGRLYIDSVLSYEEETSRSR